MPIYEYTCNRCGSSFESLKPRSNQAESDERCSCGSRAQRIPSIASIVIAGNMGPKLRTRVALDDELKKQGFSSPLFRSPEKKEQARWLLNKVGVK